MLYLGELLIACQLSSIKIWIDPPGTDTLCIQTDEQEQWGVHQLGIEELFFLNLKGEIAKGTRKSHLDNWEHRNSKNSRALQIIRPEGISNWTEPAKYLH